MQRIIEEKRRQRTVSIGSLDGMVITRDNELIAAPLVAERPPLLTAASITRISDAVMRKMEARLSTAACPSDGSASAGGETPIRCDSNVSQPSLSRKGSHAGSGVSFNEDMSLIFRFCSIGTVIFAVELCDVIVCYTVKMDLYHYKRSIYLQVQKPVLAPMFIFNAID